MENPKFRRSQNFDESLIKLITDEFRFFEISFHRNSGISKSSIIRNIGSSKLLILRKLRFSEIQNFSSNTKKQFSIQNFQVECVSIDLVILHVSILRVQCHSKETKRMVSVSNSVRPVLTVKIDLSLLSNTKLSVSLMIHGAHESFLTNFFSFAKGHPSGRRFDSSNGFDTRWQQTSRHAIFHFTWSEPLTHPILYQVKNQI